MVKLSVAYPSIYQWSVVTSSLQVLVFVLVLSLVCLRNLKNVVLWVGNDVMSEAVRPRSCLAHTCVNIHCHCVHVYARLMLIRNILLNLHQPYILNL